MTPQATCDPASGTVVVLALCLLAVVMGGGNHDVFPKFTFVNARGEEVSVEQHSNRPRCRLGEHIDVLQNPNNPNQVVADRSSRR